MNGNQTNVVVSWVELRILLMIAFLLHRHLWFRIVSLQLDRDASWRSRLAHDGVGGKWWAKMMDRQVLIRPKQERQGKRQATHRFVALMSSNESIMRSALLSCAPHAFYVGYCWVNVLSGGFFLFPACLYAWFFRSDKPLPGQDSSRSFYECHLWWLLPRRVLDLACFLESSFRRSVDIIGYRCVILKLNKDLKYVRGKTIVATFATKATSWFENVKT